METYTGVPFWEEIDDELPIRPLPTEDEFREMERQCALELSTYGQNMNTNIDKVGIDYLHITPEEDVSPALPAKKPKKKPKIVTENGLVSKKHSDGSVYSEVNESLMGPSKKKTIEPPTLPPRRYIRDVTKFVIRSSKKKDWWGLIYRLITLMCLISYVGVIVGCVFLQSNYLLNQYSALFGVTIIQTITWILVLSVCSGLLMLFCILMYNKHRGYAYTSLVTLLIFVSFSLSLVLLFKPTNTDIDTNRYKLNIMKVYGYDADITRMIDDIQTELECCGYTGNMTHNASSSWGIWKLQSKWYVFYGKKHDPVEYVPSSCCVKGVSLDKCQSSKGRSIPSYGPPIIRGVRYNNNLHTEGCYPKIKSQLSLLIYYVKIITLIHVGTTLCITIVCILQFLMVLHRNGSPVKKPTGFV